MLRRSLSYLIKGKEKTKHQHSKKDNHRILMASHLMTMETTVRSLMATTTLMVPKVTSDSLEGLGLRPAPLNHPKGSFPMQNASQTETDF